MFEVRVRVRVMVRFRVRVMRRVKASFRDGCLRERFTFLWGLVPCVHVWMNGRLHRFMGAWLQ